MAASDRVAQDAISCLSAYAVANFKAPFADINRDKAADDLRYAGLIPISEPDENIARILQWPASCQHFSDLYWGSWHQVVNYTVSPAATVASGWNSAGTISIPGKTGNYKVSLRVDINGIARWYGIK